MMSTKDPNVFDRVKRAHFDDVSQAMTTDDSELLWAYHLLRISKMLAVTSTPLSVLNISVSLPVRYDYGIYHGGSLVHTQPARYDPLSVSDLSRAQVPGFC
jgi:hypothetical protein